MVLDPRDDNGGGVGSGGGGGGKERERSVPTLSPGPLGRKGVHPSATQRRESGEEMG